MRIFFSPPFAHLSSCDDHGHRLNPGLLNLMIRIEETLVAKGHSVFSANRGNGPQHTPIDFLEMQLADCVIALPEKNDSVDIEVGWATALGKPTILLLLGDESTEPPSPFLHGLRCIHTSWSVRISCDLLASHIEQERL